MSPSLKKTILLSAAVTPFVIAGILLYRAVQPPKRQLYPQSTNVGKSKLNRPVTVSETGQITVAEDSRPIPEPVLSEGGALPAGFPPDLVTESGLAFKQSSRQDHEDEQYTMAFVEYESRNSFQKNAAYFSSYLKNGAWEILRKRDEESAFEASAVRGEDGVSISVTEAGIAQQGKPERTFVDVQIAYYMNGAKFLKEGFKNNWVAAP